MQTKLLTAAFLALPVIALADAPTRNTATAKLSVTSSAFTANGDIPMDYTCEGSEISPPLAWSTVPNNTRTIAVLVEDPDAPKGPFTHWLVTNLPSTTTGLLAGAGLPEAAMVAKNDKGNMGYAGPCPPSGRHHYNFFVYALDTSVGRPASKAAFTKAIRGHVLAQGELTGMYQKSK